VIRNQLVPHRIYLQHIKTEPVETCTVFIDTSPVNIVYRKINWQNPASISAYTQSEYRISNYVNHIRIIWFSYANYGKPQMSAFSFLRKTLSTETEINITKQRFYFCSTFHSHNHSRAVVWRNLRSPRVITITVFVILEKKQFMAAVDLCTFNHGLGIYIRILK
jgi:hypothetical protein